MVKNNENLELCGECGGKCCLAVPGIAAPFQFGRKPHTIKKALLRVFRGGGWSFDNWDPDGELEFTYYPRPALAGSKWQIVHAGWGGRCGMLNGDGCSLPFKSRPWGCQDLKPTEPGFPFCESQTGKGKINEVKAWIPFQEIIISVISELNGR